MGALYNTLSYSKTDKAIMEIVAQNDSTKETYQTTRNITSNNLYAYNLFAYIPIKKWYVGQLDFSAWYQNFIGELNGVNYNKGMPSYQVNLTNQFILPKEFSVEVSCKYQNTVQFGLIVLKPQSNIDIAIKKKFLNKKLTVVLSALDIFYKQLNIVDINFDNQNIKFKQFSDSRRVRLVLTYNFGNTKLQFNEKRKINEDEANRLNKK